MSTLGMIIMFIGVGGGIISFLMQKWKYLGISTLVGLAGMFMGIGANPSKDMPNGSPEMVSAGLIIFAISALCCLIMFISDKVKSRQIAGGSTSNYSKIFVPIIVVLLLIGIGLTVYVFAFVKESSDRYNSTHTSTENQRTCQVCGRSFSSTSSDGKNIRNTNMCNNCYSNYKYATK